MKLSGLSWRSCEGSKRVIGPLQAGRSTRNPATIETPVSDYTDFSEHMKVFTWEKSSVFTGFPRYTNMAAISLFVDQYGRCDVK